MKRLLLFFMIMEICVFVSHPSVTTATSPPCKSDSLHEITLAVPSENNERNYLGLPSSGRFKIHEIKAEIVIIEIFSMYCPHCQREASTVNTLYRTIEEHPLLKNRVKLIGIGVGNSPYEVGIFKKKYDIPFPLFPDKNFSIHKILNGVRTPYFIGATINNNEAYHVFYSEPGGIGDADQFLTMMLRLSGLSRDM